MGKHPINRPNAAAPLTRQAKAVFLDRDGVLNQVLVRNGKPYPPADLSEFVLLPNVLPACRKLKAAGFLLVVATNQPDVGRGTLRQSTVEAIHDHLKTLLPIDRIEVCYDPGEPTGSKSEFRKPRPGMLLRAARELNINLSKSYMVGDRWRDIDCGKAAGCTTLFIDYGYSETLRAIPDHIVKNLLDAASIILDPVSAAHVE